MSSIARVTLMVLGIVAGAAIVIYFYFGRISVIEHKVEVKIARQTIIADVVKTEKDRTRGLGDREMIGINEGMLFLFDKEGEYGFWMKDMEFPIDILWIKGNTIVGFEEMVDPQRGAEDYELRLYYPPTAIDKVLELSAGRVRLLHTRVGDEIFIRPLVRQSL